MNQPPEQETTVYPSSTVEQIVSSTLFFPSTLNDWFNLDLNVRNADSVSLLKSRLLSFIDPVQRSQYNPLTRLRLGFSHLNEHTF